MNTQTIIKAIARQASKGVFITNTNAIAENGIETTTINVSVPATGASIVIVSTEILQSKICFVRFSAWKTDSNFNIISNYETTLELKDVQVLVNHITVYTHGNEWLRKDIQSSGRL